MPPESTGAWEVSAVQHGTRVIHHEHRKEPPGEGRGLRLAKQSRTAKSWHTLQEAARAGEMVRGLLHLLQVVGRHPRSKKARPDLQAAPKSLAPCAILVRQQHPDAGPT